MSEAQDDNADFHRLYSQRNSTNNNMAIPRGNEKFAEIQTISVKTKSTTASKIRAFSTDSIELLAY